MLRILFKVETETVPEFGDAKAKAIAYISGKGTSAIKNLLQDS